MTHIVTVTRDDMTAPPVMRIYDKGALVLSVPLQPREVVTLIRQLAEVIQ